uniref:Reverse transcriptase Ty1/copia-type domain-containing protein n=1 Tax=Solanum lycopersicum TaxID=4081 RepID=A0A3Q7EWH3_SOLLC
MMINFSTLELFDYVDCWDTLSVPWNYSYQAADDLPQALTATNLQNTNDTLYVDLGASSHMTHHSELVRQLGKEFVMKDLGLYTSFLQLRLSILIGGIHLSQSEYAIEMLDKTRMTFAKKTGYYSCCEFSKPIYAKSEQWTSLRGKKDSQTSKKQSTVSRSSVEAEYRALASTTSEMTWFMYLLHDLGVFLRSVPTLYCDNMSAFKKHYPPFNFSFSINAIDR